MRRSRRFHCLAPAHRRDVPAAPRASALVKYSAGSCPGTGAAMSTMISSAEEDRRWPRDGASSRGGNRPPEYRGSGRGLRRAGPRTTRTRPWCAAVAGDSPGRTGHRYRVKQGTHGGIAHRCPPPLSQFVPARPPGGVTRSNASGTCQVSPEPTLLTFMDAIVVYGRPTICQPGPFVARVAVSPRNRRCRSAEGKERCDVPGLAPFGSGKPGSCVYSRTAAY